ncbi:MAG: DUF1232 domain-containing protein [Chloroflexi bacterium]|nr:DUF1232 domain-containing protein [Chloroflexota bacterium]
MVIAIGGAVILAVGLGIYAIGRRFQKREPYGTFLRLKNRQKIAFFKRLLSDRRVPWLVRIIPILVILYLINPIDLIPDFLPVLGYLDDVAIVLLALALVIRFTPKTVLLDLLEQLQTTGVESS